MSKRRSLLVAISGVFAAVLGTLWWRLRGAPVEPEAAPIAQAAIETPTLQLEAAESAPQTYAVARWLVLTLRLVAAGFGLACLTQAQYLLLASRMPFQPLMLFLLGIGLLMPITANHVVESQAQTKLDFVTTSATNGRLRRGFYLAAAAFFVFISILIAQFGRLTPLLLIVWFLGIAAAFTAMLSIRVEWRALIQQARIGKRFVLDIALVVLLPLVIGALMRTTYAPETPLPAQTLNLFIMDLVADNQPPDFYGDTSPFYIYVQNILAGPVRELSDLQRLSGIFALVLVPAVYVFGAAVYGRWTGLFAAGFTSAGLWTLALAKSGSVYPALGVCSALYLALLFEPAKHREKIISVKHIGSPLHPDDTHPLLRLQHVFAGLILGIGWLLAPEFGFMALLLPVRALFGFLDANPTWWQAAVQRIHRLYAKLRIGRVLTVLLPILALVVAARFLLGPEHFLLDALIMLLIMPVVLLPILALLIVGRYWQRAQRHVPETLVTLLITAVVVLPFVRLATTFLWIPAARITTDFQLLTGIPPLYTVLDALAYGLLMFNLTRDPSPLHGIINRPVFMPLLGALFVMGVLAWAWRIYRTQRWREGLLLVALVVTLLPAALNLTLPLSYPDALRSALALPVAVMLAGYAASIIAHNLQLLLGRIGIVLAIVLFAVVLFFVAQDAQQHMNDVALPAYESGVMIFNNQ